MQRGPDGASLQLEVFPDPRTYSGLLRRALLRLPSGEAKRIRQRLKGRAGIPDGAKAGYLAQAGPRLAARRR